MNTTTKLGSLLFCLANLAACGMINESSSYTTTYTTYQPYQYDETQFYYQSYNAGVDGGYPQPGRQVSVPDSYYLGAERSPDSHHNVDKTWVKSQNPQSYTIELADDEKAARVAGKLHKAPKNDRMAEIKYQRNGKAYYKGLYGSYNSKEDAEKAMNSLPAEIKQGAGIKDWGSVQNVVNE